MKKWLTTLLAVVMLLSMLVPAMAEDVNPAPAAQSPPSVCGARENHGSCLRPFQGRLSRSG